jgi:hypothetical protein
MKTKNHDRAPGNTAISVSLSKSLKEKIRQAADTENRSVSNYICHHLSMMVNQPKSTKATPPPKKSDENGKSA